MSHMSNKAMVKICGVTLPEQAREIARLGADYVGCVIEFPKSPRSVSTERAREIRGAVEGADRRGAINRARTVGVVVDLPFDHLSELIEGIGIRIWQLHGIEDVEYVNAVKALGVEVWKAVTRENYIQYAGVADKLLVDAKNPLHGAGGSGKLSDWDFARQLVGEGYPVVLSGGLTPDNVQEGIRSVRPFVADASSGVEISPGVKDLSKVEFFITNIKRI